VTTILVTGSEGYLGSALTDYFLQKRDDRLICVDNLRWSQYWVPQGRSSHPNYEFHNLDVRNDSLLVLARRADVIIHLAALVGAPLCEAHPEEARGVNEEATIKLVKSLSPRQRLFFACTNSIFGSAPGEIINEDTPTINPISLYGKTKLEAEKAVLDHPLGTSLSLATLYGAGSRRMRMDLLVNDFTDKIYEAGRGIRFGARFPLYEGSFYRNAVGLWDVIRVVDHLLSVRSEGALSGRFPVANHEANLTKLEFARKVCDVAGLPYSLIEEKEGADPDGRNAKVSSGRLVRLGFYFRHGLVEGIREVLRVCEFVPARERALWRNK
jgi:nucleoside-diphosphate-sugar epimerase